MNPTTAANQRQYNLKTDEHRQQCIIANPLEDEQCNTLRCNLMHEQEFQVQELTNELEVELILHHEKLMREQQSN